MSSLQNTAAVSDSSLWLKYLYALTVGLSLGACSFDHPYSIPKVAVENDHWQNQPWQPALPSDQIPRGKWWILFQDETLNSLEEKLTQENASLAIALSKYEQAGFYLKQLGAAQSPSIDSTASLTDNKQSADRPLRSKTQPNYYGASTVSIGVNYELDVWGRVKNSVQAGKAAMQAAQADSENIKLSLQVMLADLYIRLRHTDAQFELLTRTVQEYEKSLSLIQRRHEGGIASGLDVARADSQLSLAKVELSELHIQRDLYEHAIATLVGQAPSSFSMSIGNLVSIKPPQVPIGVPSSLLQRRPDIAAAERRAAAANARIGLAEAAFFPSFTLGAQAGFQNTGGADILNSPNAFWSIGPSVSLNIFDAQLRKAQAEQAKALLDQAGQEYKVVVLNAFQQVEDDLSRIRYYKEQLIDRENVAKANQKALKLALNRYKEGAVSYLEVTIAQTNALQADRALVNLQTQVLISSLGLIRSLGGGWEKPENL
jgi:NodT family efflux transporter outer membrane factor (OMF) lipoprotein